MEQPVRYEVMGRMLREGAEYALDDVELGPGTSISVAACIADLVSDRLLTIRRVDARIISGSADQIASTVVPRALFDGVEVDLQQPTWEFSAKDAAEITELAKNCVRQAAVGRN